jgi:hypothetical protein
MLNTKQVAAILGVSQETIRNRTINRVRRGKGTLIEYELHDRILRFRPAAVEAYRKKVTVAPVEGATVEIWHTRNSGLYSGTNDNGEFDVLFCTGDAAEGDRGVARFVARGESD